MKRAAIASVVLVAAAVVAVWLWPMAEGVRERLSLAPTAAWVAVETGDSGVAVVGPARIRAGASFELHAVLEARSREGRRVFYTQARRLEIGGQEFAGDALRRWGGELTAKVLWFTVEHPAPVLRLPSGTELVELRYTEHFRPDWPQAWSIPGNLETRYRAAGGSPNRWPQGVEAFGTQRYHVRIELFGPESRIRPRSRFSSPGAEALLESPGDFVTVTAALPGGLALPSEAFGLPVLEGPGLAAVGAQATELWRQRLAVSRSRLLAAMLRDRRLDPEALEWREVDLAAADVPWGADGAGGGDLLQVGERVVILARDAGIAGRLDHQDLALDYEGGAAVRDLGEVFEGEGLVEWARLPGGDG